MNNEAAAALVMRTTRKGSAHGSLSSAKKHESETREREGGGPFINACITPFNNQNTSPNLT